MTAKPKVDTAPVVLTAELEKAIRDLAEGVKRLNVSRLKRETIVLLLHDATRVGKRDINTVLDAMGQIESLCLKPKPSHPRGSA